MTPPARRATGQAPWRPDIPAEHRCPCDPACRHVFGDDMGGLDSDYDHCDACGDHWPCEHTRTASSGRL